MTFDITTIVQAVAALIAAVITAVVIPYIKSKTTIEQQGKINHWVILAVQAAEQLFQGAGVGAQKKTFVIEYLAGRGIKLDPATLDVLIEAAVFELKSGVV